MGCMRKSEGARQGREIRGYVAETGKSKNNI